MKCGFCIALIFLVSFVHASENVKSEDAIPSWKWNGDLRLRAQQEITWPEDSRLSEKLRLRFGVKVEVEANLKAEIRLATARTNNSANQTLGDSKDPGPARRFIGLDLAYASWKPAPFLTFSAGRIPQVHYRPGQSQILLSSNLALEGASIKAEHFYNDNLGFFANFGSTWIRENYDTYYSQKLTDNMLNWGQIGVKWKGANSVTAVGLGFFNYTALQGLKFSDVSAGGAARGNSEAPQGIYKNAYIPRQYFIETRIEEGSFNYGLFLEKIMNGETIDPNQALWTGLAASQGLWSVQVGYAEVQSDAVPGVFTDSDFADGTTNMKGYLISMSYKLRKNLNLSLAQYLNRKINGIENTQYSRTHLDMLVDF